MTAKIRTRNAERTRAAILEAAQNAFSIKGYGAVGLREIAGNVSVDPALILRYFHSKRGLFEKALRQSLDWGALLETDRENFGRHIANILADKSRRGTESLPMMMLAMADSDVNSMITALLDERIMAPLAEWIGGEDALNRAAHVSILCAGFLIYTRFLPIGLFANGVDDTTREWFAQELQKAIDQ